MSRSGYSDDYGWDDHLALGRWRGAVASALRGARGQAFLREMADALDAMSEKRLLAEVIVCPNGVCAMGAVAARRGIGPDRFYDEENVPPEQIGQPIGDAIDIRDREAVAKLLGIAPALSAEIAYVNDEGTWKEETPEERWTRVRAWVAKKIKEPKP